MDLTSDAREHCNWLDMQKPGESVPAGTLRWKRVRTPRLLLSSNFLWRFPSRRISKTGIFLLASRSKFAIDISWKRFIEWDMKKANVLDDSSNFGAFPWLCGAPFRIIHAEMAAKFCTASVTFGGHVQIPELSFCITGTFVLRHRQEYSTVNKL